jgi:hypothetical protein
MGMQPPEFRMRQRCIKTAAFCFTPRLTTVSALLLEPMVEMP